MFTSRTIGDDVSGPVGWSDKISIEKIRDGASNTLLIGEAHKPVDGLKLPPTDGPIYSGYEFPSIARLGGPGRANHSKPLRQFSHQLFSVGAVGMPESVISRWPTAVHKHWPISLTPRRCAA